MTEQEPINLNIVDGEAFFAHEVSVNFTPTQFMFDFKCITPRNDPRTKSRASFLMKHNVIMVEPWHAKAVVQVLANVINKYEEEFGKITKPKAVTLAEKKHKKQSKKKPGETPSYFG